ncbi:UNVERIFIED_CONTAM: hypothetical protein Sangu_2866600 [Sesamum angustifolium]|uniref:Retrotransposon Copia-like N-terminal domain-containing protein n=1 Tax=Sesamum angustifolium TaxID=2727405 RepID=A0AAW2INT8_9LAMI
MATEAATQTTVSALDRLKSETLQLHSSEHPGMMLVSTPLDGKNFLSWSRAVRRALGAKSKLDFITGTCIKPMGAPELLEQWIRVDCMFLMGLNEEYDTVRSQILVTEPLPSINKAYSMILRVERQKQVHMGESHEGAALFVEGVARKREDSLRGQGYKKKGWWTNGV